MQNLTPEQIFFCTYFAAALSGLAVLLRSDNALTVRSVTSTILFYGSTGVGLGMIAFEWLGGKQNPWRVIGCGFLVGLRFIKTNDIVTMTRRILNISEPPDDKEDKK